MSVSALQGPQYRARPPTSHAAFPESTPEPPAAARPCPARPVAMERSALDLIENAPIQINVKIIRMPTVKKTWLIDPELVRRAQKISGARTETETVTKALEEIVVRDEIEAAFRRHGPGLAKIETIFPDGVVRGLKRASKK
jgi:hypothetical protein